MESIITIIILLLFTAFVAWIVGKIIDGKKSSQCFMDEQRSYMAHKKPVCKQSLGKYDFDVTKLKIGNHTFEKVGGHYIEDIKMVECEVISTPQSDDLGRWTWEAKRVHCEGIVNYCLTEGYEYLIKLYHCNPYSHIEKIKVI